MYDAVAGAPARSKVSLAGMKLTATRFPACRGPRKPNSSSSRVCTGNRWCCSSSRMRVSTCRQNSATVDCGGALSTSGTTPAIMPGSVLESGCTRRLTGKSKATSDPEVDQPRTNSAQAAVITEYRRIRKTFVSSLISLTVTSSI
ncbi:Uncharacterised protein [Mycobacteroides abscessus]|nr:Uncharacterised protein [Mycobacteroides abscessus]SKV45231.1 Uncharacterised protein [Mycobacteroides abscessus subsp. abscessus]